MLSARRGFVIHKRDAAKHLAGQTGHQIGTEHLAGESLFDPTLSGRTSPQLGIVTITKSALVARGVQCGEPNGLYHGWILGAFIKEKAANRMLLARGIRRHRGVP